MEGKKETELNAERDRLLKLIESEVEKQAREGKTSQGDAKEKKETLVKNRKENAKRGIDKKLKEGHQKLTVKMDELPVQLFAPHKSFQDKLNSLHSLEEISDFNNKLVTEINKRKEEKLEVIRDDAITRIEKEIGNSKIELGQNKDFKKKIKEAKDPDVIEMLEKNILTLIKEQKSESNEENIDDGLSNTGSPNQNS